MKSTFSTLFSILLTAALITGCNNESDPYVCTCDGEAMAFQPDATTGADSMAECVDSGEIVFLGPQTPAEAAALFEASCCPAGADPATCGCTCVVQ